MCARLYFSKVQVIALVNSLSDCAVTEVSPVVFDAVYTGNNLQCKTPEIPAFILCVCVFVPDEPSA